MDKEYLIDTNILIEYTGNLLPESANSFISQVIDKQFTISIINKIEILGHNTAGKDIDIFIGLADIIELTEPIANKTIEIRKAYKTKLPDAIIAATAIVNKLSIVTRDIKDFEKIEGLKVLNPYDI
jgi:predicted nucleic acid-binding protein